jgi:hypothetical protein
MVAVLLRLAVLNVALDVLDQVAVGILEEGGTD